jgi:hypothetical protein
MGLEVGHLCNGTMLFVQIVFTTDLSNLEGQRIVFCLSSLFTVSNVDY